ncbi:bifunctional 2',3'-cyclic-nucleotide 2'-phosphodiesterase/3'-nucleotidase [Agarivorans sp. JK6]|uniref:bifunctional 2',3'-cyclic-nucleotide 2'-phosphodiesterase/3'-nucleotidase n=1 Tax=Agarivorans sp. JK6 TaxID=2997426 RepID=UPI0038732359
MDNHFPLNKLLLASAITVSLTACWDNSSNNSYNELEMELRLMETTDLHSNMKPYNYFASPKDNALSPQDYGLARTAVLIKEARAEALNSMLFDNGDLIQGSPMGDYVANLGVAYLERNVHPVYKAMNYLGYDVGNIGNHEFNYGLDYLAAATSGANFPYINANVYQFEGKQPTNNVAVDEETCAVDIDKHFAGNYAAFFEQFEPYFTPYEILERDFTATDGGTYTVKVGVIGFTPPNILNWDKRYLECKVMLADIKMTAEHYVPKMKAEGADIIVAIPHSGLSGGDRDEDFMDNASWQLAQVDGIDALMFGHDHNNFPTTSNTYDGMEGVDAPNGKIFGKPAVMPGFWGNHLGVIDLTLRSSDRGETWAVKSSSASLRSLKDDPYLQDEMVNYLVSSDHEGTMDFMAEEIGNIDEPINSYFSAVESDISVQIVNEAQYSQGLSWQDDGVLDSSITMLSVSAPFKGGRGGREDYTNIDGDALTRASVADLYVFDNNTPAVLELTVADLIEWMEVIVAQQYQTVAEEGDRLLHQQFRSYNFDVFFGGFDADGESLLTYSIDVSQAPRYQVNEIGELVYDANGNLIQTDSRRISNIMYAGEALENDLTKKLYVVTNNYRASQSWMPGVANARIAHEDEVDSNRDLVNNYLNAKSDDLADPNDILEFPNAHNFTLVGPSGVTVEFLSSHLEAAESFANTYLPRVTPTQEFDNVADNEGFRVFTYTFD